MRQVAKEIGAPRSTATVAVDELAEAKGVRLDETHNRYTPRTATVAALAKKVGVSERTARHRLQMAFEAVPSKEKRTYVYNGTQDLKKPIITVFIFLPYTMGNPVGKLDGVVCGAICRLVVHDCLAANVKP